MLSVESDLGAKIDGFKTTSLCEPSGGALVAIFRTPNWRTWPGMSSVSVACAAQWSWVTWMTMTSSCCGDAYRTPCGACYLMW